MSLSDDPSAGSGRRVTLADVARRAGVDASTVSRALRRPGRISDSTTRTVLEAAEALGYRPGAPGSQPMPRRRRRFVADAVVVRAPDERWGEVPVAITASASDLADGISAVAHELGAPARPARVIHVDSVPVLGSGKPDRVALTELASRA